MNKITFVNKIQQLIHENYLLILMIGLGIVLRIYNIDAKSLWVDEAQLYLISNGNYSEIITNNAHFNSTPVLFPFIVNTVLHFGNSEFLLRFPSFIFGVLCIPALYILSREFLTKFYSLSTTLLFTLSAKQIYYSQQVREYSLAMLLSLLLNYYYVKLIKKINNIDLIITSILMTTAIWTQYGLILLISSLQCIMLLFLIYKKFFLRETISRKQIIHFFTLSFVMLINCAFVYFTSYRFQFVKGGFGSGYLSEGYWSGTLHSIIDLALINSFEILNFSYFLSLLWLIIIPCAFTMMIKTKKGLLAIFFMLIPLSIVFICAVLRLYPYIAGRQIMPFISFIYIILAFGIKYFHQNVRRDIFVYFTLIVLIQGIIEINILYNQKGPEHIRPIMNKLLNQAHNKDIIYVYYGAQPAFKYYYPFQNNNKRIVYGIKSRDKNQKYFAEIDTLLKNQNIRVWFVFSHDYKSEIELISAHLVKKYGAVEASSDEGTSLLLIK